MRIAIVGSGIAGLSCAWLLKRAHDVVLFEADNRFGGHAHSHDVTHEGETHVLDSGFIVCNERTYPNLMKLFGEIGITTKASDMSFGVRCRSCDIEYSSRGLASLFATPSLLASPGHYRLLVDISRFGRLGKAFLKSPTIDVSLGAFLQRHRFSGTFKRHFILPMAGAVWSASFERVLDFDTAAFLRFFDNHGWLTLNGAPQWLTVAGGSREYVRRLVSDLGPAARQEAAVTSVRRKGPGVELTTASQSSVETFDHVVFACHANDALRLLSDHTEPERSALSSFTYSTNRTLLHADRDALPRRTSAWASWNCDLSDCRDNNAPVSLTYHLNRLQALTSSTQYCVTLNPAREPNARVFAEMSYTHPILDRTAVRAQNEVRGLSGRDRVHFAGAHLYNGFHEDGIRSAVDVARALGVSF